MSVIFKVEMTVKKIHMLLTVGIFESLISISKYILPVAMKPGYLYTCCNPPHRPPNRWQLCAAGNNPGLLKGPLSRNCAAPSRCACVTWRHTQALQSDAMRVRHTGTGVSPRKQMGVADVNARTGHYLRMFRKEHLCHARHTVLHHISL